MIEYFGYGYSLSTKNARNVESFIHEINTALQETEIYGSYTILANGMSGLYALAYTNSFPESVERLILVDSIYPATINETYVQKYIKDQKFNITLTSFVELTGYARILSYIKPEIFGIDKMKEYGFSNNDISLYRKMIANRFYTNTMKNEYKLLDQNMEQLSNYTFPEYLSVTQILSDEYVKEFVEYKNQNLMKKDIQDYAEDLITNPEIQKIIIVSGEKDNLNLSNPEAVIGEVLTK